MNQKFKSNGKLMLTGEYLVLKGAISLALPLKFGQSMDVETLDSNENLIYWNAFRKTTDYGLQTTNIAPWFSIVLDKNDFSIIKTDDKEKSERLSNILSKTKSLNSNIFSDSHDYKFSTLLDFDPQWGLGSSSTLINNVSEWAEINPYALLDLTFKGSGYDIACAKSDAPIFYKRQPSEINGQSYAANFNPIFKDNLYFVYQGHKQNSSNEVKAFLAKEKNYDREIESISEISKILPNIQTLSDFCYFIKTHEELMAVCLEQNRIKKYFPEFEGEMKSLGAWGGDFFLAATSWDETKVKNYFHNKGLNEIFKYKDIVL